MGKLIPLALLLVMAGCSPAQPETVAGPSSVQVVVAGADFEVGQPRVPFVLYDGIDQIASARTVTIVAFDISTDPPTEVWTGPAENFSDYEIPYWVVYPDLPTSGVWGLGAAVTLADGTPVPGQFVIETTVATTSPQIGEMPPASQNRTLATNSIEELTSGDNPIPALYEMTVAEALESGRPTVVTLATPAYCTSKMCAPVVRSVEAVYADYSDEVNFIHLEVFKDFETLEPADELAEWGLTTEPWTYVLDADGVVVARFAGPVSPRELAAALAPLLS